MVTVAFHFARRRPARCPNCGSSRVARILYGMPSSDVLPDIESGQVVLGGCGIADLDPSWECLDCHGQVHAESLRASYTADPAAFE